MGTPTVQNRQVNSPQRRHLRTIYAWFADWTRGSTLCLSLVACVRVKNRNYENSGNATPSDGDVMHPFRGLNSPAHCQRCAIAWAGTSGLLRARGRDGSPALER